MANYSYIHLKRKVSSSAFQKALLKAVQVWFRGRMQIVSTDLNDGGPTWWVYVPDSHSPCRETLSEYQGFGMNVTYQDRDFGFAVALQSEGKVIAFRHHPFNAFESWAQGCVAEQLSEYYNQGIYYEDMDRTTRAGPHSYRSRRRFGTYITRKFGKPPSKDDQLWIKRIKDLTPEGWW